MTFDNTVAVKQHKNNFLEEFKPYLFDQNKPIAKPELFISIDGEIISSLGNVLAISGPQKCGKTALAGAIIAGNLNPNPTEVDTLGLDVAPNSQGHAIIYINTEMGQVDFDRLIRKVLSRAKLKEKPDFFYALNFTGMGAYELRQKTETFVTELAQITPIRAIIIDGIADYVSNILDPEESTAITLLCLKMAKDLNAVVVEVIHKNHGKGDTKSRGHLGSDISRKCEGTLDLKLEAGSVMIKGTDLRNASSGKTVLLMKYDGGDFVSAGTRDLGKSAILQNKKTKMEVDVSILKNIFKDQDKMKYGELVKRIVPEFKVQDRTAKSKIKALVDGGKLSKNDDGTYSLK